MAEVTVKVGADTRPIEDVMRVIARHLAACADDLARLREDGDGRTEASSPGAPASPFRPDGPFGPGFAPC